MLQATNVTSSQNVIELGILECDVDGGTGFIFGSTKDISCVFTSAREELEEDNYLGVINKYGLDIGSTEHAYMSWLVVAFNFTGISPGFLKGNYIGATASASVSVGLGANVLIEGAEQAFALQPIGIETQSGFNLAAGIAEIELQPVGQY